ncbi:hypothetical protein Tco_0861178 [Tanacetum coccineum]|uniref:Uncharacterized protein n=1 Tax=Tanacetum coccineum TaxID=301880 RepID=A0ABQ5BH21_9ASTR
MADFWKAMDLNKFVVKDDMIDYVLHMYGSNWQVHDAIADDILDDLLKREWEKQKRVKYDKRKVTQMNIQDLFEKKIEKARQHLNKEKQIMHINKGKEKMVMERDVVIIESDTSFDYFPGQTTSDESSDHNPFQVTSDESSNDTLKSSSEDTCSSDWVKVDEGQALVMQQSQNQKKSNSRSKHLAPTTPRTGSTCTTVVVQTKSPPPVTNSVLGLTAVTAWQQIMNKEFGMKSSKKMLEEV